MNDPSKCFDVIVADPPWSFNDKLTMSTVRRGSDAQYATMCMEDIYALPIKDIAADDAILALWVPSSMIEEGITTVSQWGFVTKQIYTWVKQTKSGGIGFGMGRQFRGATENALIGTRGKPKPLSKSERNIDFAPNLKHSQKPELLQDKLDRMYPEARKLELFARRDRPGWKCTGLECPSTLGIDISEWLDLWNRLP